MHHDQSEPHALPPHARTAIGHRLREVREQLGESQERFAQRLGTRKLALLTYEHGRSRLGVDQLVQLAQTGVDASYVAFGTPSLITQAARARFAAALEKVRTAAVDSEADFRAVDQVEAAWQLFCSSASMTANEGETPWKSTTYSDSGPSRNAMSRKRGKR